MLCAVIFSPAAWAGSYHVIADCPSPTGVNHAFVPSSTDTTSFTTTTTCPTGDGQDAGIHVGEVLHSPSPIAGGAHAGYTVTAPAGTTITGISYRRYLGQFDDRDTIPGLRDASGTLIGNEWCQYPSIDFSCSVGSPFISTPPVAITGLSTSSLAFGLRCVPEAPATICLSSASDEQAWFSVYSADVTINETTSPTLGSVSGSLTSSGWLRGTQTVSLASATDPSGIQSLGLAIESGTPAAPSSGSPTPCDFTFPKPCANTASSDWSLDTSTLADGPHTATISATNAAGVSSSSAPIAFASDNTAPDPPLQLASSAGTDWQGSPSTQLTWTLPDHGQGSPIATAFIQLCDSHGQTCSPAQPAGSLTGETVTAPTAGAYTIDVWLGDNAGNADPALAASVPLRYATGAPPPPTRFTSSADAWQSSRRISAGWLIPPRGPDEPPIIAGRVQACAPDGSGCGTPQPVGPSGGEILLPHEGIFLLRAWLIDAAHHQNPAAAATTTARVSSTPPRLTITRLAPHGAALRPAFRVRFTTRPGGFAPVVATRWRLCSRHGCPRFGQASGGTVTGAMPAPGRWTLSLQSLDAAGVNGAPTSRVLRFRPRPQLHASIRRRRDRLVLHVSTDRRLTASVHIQIRLRLADGTRSRRLTAHLRDGQATRAFVPPQSVASGRVTVTFAGSTLFHAARASLRFPRASVS